jgi:hypothetical protein
MSKFNPSDIPQWVSKIDCTWNEWKHTTTNPDHMTAVELTREILKSDDEDWRSWASQDKLRNAGRKTKKESALLAGHGIKKGNNPFKTGTKNKICGNKGCNNLVSRFRYYNPCYTAHWQKTEAVEDNAAVSSVPANVCAQTREKKLTNLKKKMAQMSNVKKSGRRSVLLAEATALLADVLGVVISGPFFKILLHNHFITEMFLKKIRRCKLRSKFSLFVLLHKRAKPAPPPCPRAHSARELKPYTPPLPSLSAYLVGYLISADIWKTYIGRYCFRD